MLIQGGHKLSPNCVSSIGKKAKVLTYLCCIALNFSSAFWIGEGGLPRQAKLASGCVCFSRCFTEICKSFGMQ